MAFVKDKFWLDLDVLDVVLSETNQMTERAILGDSGSNVVNTGPQLFLVKIMRGSVATYWAGDGQPEMSTTVGAKDCGSLRKARTKSRELLFDKAMKTDCTEVEMVTK